METFAGFGEHTDEQVGRLVDALHDMGVMDNTLFIYIVGDNGASAEGGPGGRLQRDDGAQRHHQHRRDQHAAPRRLGRARPPFPHYAIGWAWAGDTPFQWTKQIASHYGGTTNGVVDPLARAHQGEGRDPFAVHARHRHRAHRAGSGGPSVPEERERHRAAAVRRHLDGLHLRRRRAAKETHTTQYFEMFGNRGIYHDGWIACSAPLDSLAAGARIRRLPTTCGSSTTSPRTSARRTTWRRRIRRSCKEMQDLFMKEAERNHVLPIDDRRSERFDAEHRRPARPDERAHVATVYPGMIGHDRERVHQRQELPVHDHGAGRAAATRNTNGVIIAQAGAFGGWTLYMKDGKRPPRIQLLRRGAHQHRRRRRRYPRANT